MIAGRRECREVMPPQRTAYEKGEGEEEKREGKEAVQVKEDGRLDKAKITTIPSYTPGNSRNDNW